MTRALFVSLISLLVLCQVQAEELRKDVPAPAAQSQPFKRSSALKWMQDSAEYRALTLATYAAARARVEDLAHNWRQGDVPWVVVMDADETILDNSVFQLESEQQGVGFSPQRWRAWVERKDADAVPGAAGFFARVLALGGKVAIITNRDVDFVTATAENLRKLGFATDAARVCILGRPKNVVTPPFGNDKDVRRQELRDGKASACWQDKQGSNAQASWARPQDLVMHIGDNVQDLPGVTQKAAAAHPDIVAEHIGRDWFLLPNPVYGSWD